MRTEQQQQQEYIFEAGVAEHTRLVEQATLFDPLTERLLVAAGVGPGMRVLDLGTGAGSVALVAARLVGPEGSVVTVDRDPYALTLAAEHAEREGVRTIEFVEGDLAVPDLPGGLFDAVVSRFVLMYCPTPPRRSTPPPCGFARAACCAATSPRCTGPARRPGDR